MHTRWLTMGAMMVAVLAMVAIGTGPAEAKDFQLMGQEDSPAASGTASLEGTKLTVTAQGLKANAVYTVWFVNMQPTMTKVGAGTAPYSFKTDAQGKGTYVTQLGESPVGKWQVIFIVRHPSGNPTDMTMKDALMTKLM